MSVHSKEAVIKVLGIDLAKRSFHLFGVDGDGRQVLSKKLTRARVSEFVANLPPCAVAMEACGSARYWARQFRRYGHKVRNLSTTLRHRRSLFTEQSLRSRVEEVD